MVDRPPRTIKFLRAQVEDLDQDRCRAVVEVQGAAPGAAPSTGKAEGPLAELDRMRAVARATADAISAAIGTPGVSVRLRGIQGMEAFGQTVIVVSLVASKEGRTQSLLGVCDGGEDRARAAALAVLNATNRFLGVG